MHDRTLALAATRLLRGGVAPRHVRRAVEELRSHRADLIVQLRAQGHDVAGAAREAESRLGSVEDFVQATLARPELRGWASRLPWLVFAILPVIGFLFAGVALVLLLIGWVEVVVPAAGMLLVTALASAVTLQLVAPDGAAKGALSVGAGYPPRDTLRVLFLFGVAFAGIVTMRARRASNPA